MKFLIRLANYFTMIYSRTPKSLRWVFWVALLFYFVMPFDLLPDMAPVLGRLDDFLMIIFWVWIFERSKNFGDFFRQARREKRSHDSSDQASEEESTFSAHEVLGVAPGAKPVEIKSAYRKCLSMYHPDKFAHLGPEFEIMARKKTEAIIAAYRELTV